MTVLLGIGCLPARIDDLLSRVQESNDRIRQISTLIATIVLRRFAQGGMSSKLGSAGLAEEVVRARIVAEHIMATKRRMEAESHAVGCDLGRGR
jgi:hypothetical protein